MKIYGVPASKLSFKDDAEYGEKEKNLRGLHLDDKIKALGLASVKNEDGETYIGITPMYPWENTKDIGEITTVGKAKRFIGRSLTPLVEEDLDTVKSYINFYEG